MGAVDVERQALNVFRMRLLGAEVEAVESGSRTLKDAVNEAMRDWVATVGHSHYCLGSVMGPHPYPYMVRQFHRVIGDEASEQCATLLGGDPDVVVACVGGGSNAMGIFTGFVDGDARLVGVEPAGRSGRQPWQPRRGPRDAQLPDAGRGGPGRGGAVDLGRARLPGCRPGALVPRVDRPRRVPVRHRCRGDRRVPAAGAQPKGSSRRSNARTPWPGSPARRRRSRARRC